MSNVRNIFKVQAFHHSKGWVDLEDGYYLDEADAINAYHSFKFLGVEDLRIARGTLTKRSK